MIEDQLISRVTALPYLSKIWPKNFITHDEYDRISRDLKGNSIAVLVKDLAEELQMVPLHTPGLVASMLVQVFGPTLTAQPIVRVATNEVVLVKRSTAMSTLDGRNRSHRLCHSRRPLHTRNSRFFHGRCRRLLHGRRPLHHCRHVGFTFLFRHETLYEHSSGHHSNDCM
jgi:hypothetical protein